MHDCEHDCPSEPSCVTLFSICWLTRYSCRVLCEANRELAITWQWSCWNNQAEGKTGTVAAEDMNVDIYGTRSFAFKLPLLLDATFSF